MEQIKKNVILGVGLGLVASFMWGSWPVISKLATIQHLSGVDITLLRFLVAGAILLPVLFYRSISLRTITTKGVLLAIGAGAPYVLLATTGLQVSSSAHFGLITPSTMLLFSTLGSVLWFKESMKPSKLIGILFIVIGVAIIGGSSVGTASTSTLMGDVMFIGCGLLWASYTLLCKYWELNAWVATALVSVVSALFCFPLFVMNISNMIERIPIEGLIMHGVFQGVLVGIVALYCYSKAVSILGATQGAVFACLAPPVSLLLSVFLLDEPLEITAVIGLISICSGMLISLRVITLRTKGDKRLQTVRVLK
ncbi:DMT family transporter [Aliivibrio kagoshimensis]|uniref:DMT family transporter n=1 Tax=Aliivibrio kagoshimensis TaxID=2910230 RepID=UPI003D0EB67E